MNPPDLSTNIQTDSYPSSSAQDVNYMTENTSPSDTSTSDGSPSLVPRERQYTPSDSSSEHSLWMPDTHALPAHSTWPQPVEPRPTSTSQKRTLELPTLAPKHRPSVEAAFEDCIAIAEPSKSAKQPKSDVSASVGIPGTSSFALNIDPTFGLSVQSPILPSHKYTKNPNPCTRCRHKKGAVSLPCDEEFLHTAPQTNRCFSVLAVFHVVVAKRSRISCGCGQLLLRRIS